MTVTIRILEGFQRHDIANLLDGEHHVGVELGVAEGIFSERMVRSGKFDLFFGVDMYADSHDTRQYKRALTRVGLHAPYRLLRMRFDEAFDLFEDASFDFVYVDGYAHAGEEGGATIFDWYRKVRVGGILAGDDYSPAWPLVCEAVNELATQLGTELLLTQITEPNNQYCRYPTWAIRKLEAKPLHPPAELILRGRREMRRILLREEGTALKRGVKAVCPPVLLRWAKQLRG